MMISDWNEVCQETGFDANTEAEESSMLGWIDGNMLAGVREELSTNYNLELDYQEIEDLMEDNGITFGYEGEYSVADLIYDSLQEDS